MRSAWSMTLYSRRRFLTALTGGGALLLLACAPAAPTPTPAKPAEAPKPAAQPTPTPAAAPKPAEVKPAAPAAVQLTYWHSWTEQWEEMTKYVCEEFSRATGIGCQEVVVPGRELLTKLLASVAAGNPPDVITIYSAINIPSLVEQQALVPFDQYASQDEIGRAKQWFHPAVWRMGEYKGQIWGFSYWQQASALAWNKRIFKEAGLDPEKPPTTTQELDQLAEKLTTYDSRGNIDRMGFLPANLWITGTAFGGSFYDEQNRKITANHPNNVKALEWIVSYSKKFDVKKITAFQTGLASERAGVLDPFVSGKFAMQIIGGPWKLGDFRKYAPKEGLEYGVAPHPNPPGMTGTSTWSYGDFTVVPKGTKYPAEAWKFVKFTSGAEGNVEQYVKVLFWGDRPINVPVSTKVLDHPKVQAMIRDYPGFQMLIDLFLKGDRVGMPPKTPVGTFYAQRLAAAEEKARLLEQSPQEALDKVTQEVQAEQDKFFEQQKR